MVTDDELIKRYQRIHPERSTHGYDIRDVIHAFGSPLEALLYGRLFWPDLVELEGMTLLRWIAGAESDRATVLACLDRYSGDRARIEREFNTLEIEELFGKNVGDTTDEQDIALAEQLRETWHCRLERAYPGRKFNVEVVSAEETGGSVAVRFWESR